MHLGPSVAQLDTVPLATLQGTPIIYVNLNYRVGPFGFPQGAEAMARGALNLGLKDQLAALSWVKQNIAAFGGDPDKVGTVKARAWLGVSAQWSIGDSLRSKCRVDLNRRPVPQLWSGEPGSWHGECRLRQLVLAPGNPRQPHNSNPLQIMSSGFSGTTAVFNATRRETEWTNFVNATSECSGKVGTNVTFSCMRNASLATLLSAYDTSSAVSPESFQFVPVIDGPGGLIPDLPSTLMAEGKFSRIPLITGANLDDGKALTST